MSKIEIVYPSFTKKAVTFTIDDGNMKYDSMLLAILKPRGILGTFNLCSDLHLGKEEQTREFYSGYGIANHQKYHPIVNYDGVDYVISEDDFDPATANASMIYRVAGKDGFFWYMKPNGWRQMVFEDDFLSYIKEGKSELEEILGISEVKDFVWPYGEQNNAAAHELIRKLHRSARITGCTLDTTRFAIPSDKYAWSYNADHRNLLEVMEKYERYPDDGELKFFAFGVHSADFERDGKWEELSIFADKYGSRPETYWYASVGDIFDYDEAVSGIVITEEKVVNGSDLAVYLKVDGECVILEPHSELVLRN